MNDVGGLHHGRVVADGHVTAVVRPPSVVTGPLSGGDVPPLGDCVRRQQVLLVGLDGEGRAHVQDVRFAALALELHHGVYLVLARALGVLAGDLDAVLFLERTDDGAIVAPVVWEGYHIEGTLGFGGGDEAAHAAEGRHGGGRRVVVCCCARRAGTGRHRGGGTADQGSCCRSRTYSRATAVFYSHVRLSSDGFGRAKKSAPCRVVAPPCKPTYPKGGAVLFQLGAWAERRTGVTTAADSRRQC